LIFSLGETNVVPVILPPEIEALWQTTLYGIWVSPIWFVAASGLPLTPCIQEEMDRLVAGMVATREVQTNNWCLLV